MAIAVPAESRARGASNVPPLTRRNNTLFRRVSAQAMGMESDSLCHKSHWVPKSSRSACANCKRAFRLFKAKHHCRLCGEVVCGPCSTKRILFQKKSVRSCDECVDHSVQAIAHYNRRSSSAPYALTSGSSSDESMNKEDSSSKSRALASRYSDSNLLKALRKQAADPARPRRKSQPATSSSSSSFVLRNPEASAGFWRTQLPYALVLLIMAVAGITNVLAVLL